jgi:hypothetical protein
VSFSQITGRGDFPIGYRALEYRAPDNQSGAPDPDKVIFIVNTTTEGELSIRVRSDWRKIVRFEDLRERAIRDLENLLKQLSFLSVGRLQTYASGQTLGEYPELLRLLTRFREF